MSEPPPATSAAPYSAADLRAALRPDLASDLILSHRDRLVATIIDGKSPGLLVALMLLCAAVAALPYGLVLGWSSSWKIAALFVGSVAICAPSLHVFSTYLGASIRPTQSLVLGLIVAVVAAVFTFGFFPILWFLSATMGGDSATITAGHVSVALLAVSLLAGLGHLLRCVHGNRVLTALQTSPILIYAWQALLVFITYRMAHALELL